MVHRLSIAVRYNLDYLELDYSQISKTVGFTTCESIFDSIQLVRIDQCKLIEYWYSDTRIITEIKTRTAKCPVIINKSRNRTNL